MSNVMLILFGLYDLIQTNIGVESIPSLKSRPKI